jgi:hypothetical protein
VAVRIDIDALLESLPVDVLHQALDASTRFRSLRSSDGGARAAVTTADGGVLDCWVGVVDGALAADCECRAERRQPLCAHAVVVARAAVDAGLPWSANATPPGLALPKTAAEWVQIADGLTHRELVRLVAGQAAQSRPPTSAEESPQRTWQSALRCVPTPNSSPPIWHASKASPRSNRASTPSARTGICSVLPASPPTRTGSKPSEQGDLQASRS